jgi:hypothetical protein
MPHPTEAAGSNCEPSEDRGLADMLTREIPRRLPIGLAALAADLAERLRNGEASAKPVKARAEDRDLTDDPRTARAAG